MTCLSPAFPLKRKLLTDRRYPVFRWLMTLGLLVLLSSPVLANELWIAPEKQNQDKKVGNWAVANLGGETHFSFRVPDDLQAFTEAAVVLISPHDGPLTYDLHLNRTANLMPHTANPVDLLNNVTPFLNAGLLTELDVTAAFAGVAAQDYVSLNFELQGKQATTQVVGLRFRFVGPAGPQGSEGPQGPPGPSGALGLAGQTCPSGQFVTGFDLSGRILCSAPPGSPPGGGGTPSGISLAAVAQLIANALNGLIGNEGAGTPISFSNSFANGSITIVGFALCQPPNLNAPPNPTPPPLYGCAPNVQVTAVTQASNSVTITVNLSHVYADLTGQVQVVLPFPFGTESGSLEGFVLLDGVQVTLTAPLVDAGGGMYTLGPASQAGVTTTTSQVNVNSNNTAIDLVLPSAQLIASLNFIFSQGLGFLGGAIQSAVTPVLTSLPPFMLTP